jgi:hypothetical protein
MLNRLLYALKLRKRPGYRATRDEMLKAIPLRNRSIKWEKDEKGEISLVIQQRKRLWVKIISKLFMIPSNRVVALDEIGSFVWEMCDGTNNVGYIISSLSNKYSLTRKEAEVSLLAFFRQLGKRGFVGFAVDKKAIERRENR